MQTIELNAVGARRYSFEDRDSKRLVEGVNIYYLNEEVNDDVVGVIPAKVTLPYDAWNKVSRFPFPCACDATLTQTLTAKGVKTNVTDINLSKRNDK